MPSPLRRRGSRLLQIPRPGLLSSPNSARLDPLGPLRGVLSTRQSSLHVAACSSASPRFDARFSADAGGWLSGSSGGLPERDSHPPIVRPFAGHTAIRTTWINLKGSHTASYADSVDGSRGVARRSRLARVRAGLTGAAREISGRRRVRPRLTFSKYLARRLGSKRRLGSLVQFLHQAVWSGVVLPILAVVESDLRLLPLLLLLPAAGQDHAAAGSRANHFRGVRICAARTSLRGLSQDASFHRAQRSPSSCSASAR